MKTAKIILFLGIISGTISCQALDPVLENSTIDFTQETAQEPYSLAEEGYASNFNSNDFTGTDNLNDFTGNNSLEEINLEAFQASE